MNQIKFTKATLNALEAGDGAKRVYYYDERARGLCVQVAAKIKAFYLLRKVAGKTERFFIGRYPDITIEQARKRAGQINSDIDGGINPNELKRVKRRELTLLDLFNAYMQRHALLHNRRPQNAQNDYRRYLSQWNSRKLSDIAKRDVLTLHSDLGSKVGHGTANKVLTLLRALFNKAIEWELWQAANPTDKIKKFREHSRERFLLPEEMPLFLAALRKVESETQRHFILILLLTGVRRGNALEMRWRDVHLEDAVWRIPDTKIGEPHTVALVPEAVAILRKRDETKAGEYVFSGESTSGHLEEPKRAWAVIRKTPGFETLRMHDLRRTHGSWMASTGANLSMIGKALGHKNLSTTTIYARLNLDPVRQAVTIATRAMMQGAGELIPSAKVIKLEKVA